jgi:hypothetical protein
LGEDTADASPTNTIGGTASAGSGRDKRKSQDAGKKQGNFFANLRILALSAKSDDFRPGAENLQGICREFWKSFGVYRNRTLSVGSWKMHLMRRELAGNFANSN